MTLPAGHTSRPMVLEDAKPIAEHSAAYTSTLLGFPKHSPEDVANYLRDPAINLTTDGWVVLDPNGNYTGSATAMPVAGNTQLNIDILSNNPAILNWLLDQAEHRAHDLANPAGGVVLRVGVVRQDRLLPEVLAARGFAIGTSVQRMRIGFDGAVVAPATPEGVVVRRGRWVRRAGGRRTACWWRRLRASRRRCLGLSRSGWSLGRVGRRSTGLR